MYYTCNQKKIWGRGENYTMWVGVKMGETKTDLQYDLPCKLENSLEKKIHELAWA